jgi:hypothetical protein
LSQSYILKLEKPKFELKLNQLDFSRQNWVRVGGYPEAELGNGCGWPQPPRKIRNYYNTLGILIKLYMYVVINICLCAIFNYRKG